MKIAKSYNKNNGVTYVYEILDNRWDPVKKRGIPTRRMIGKIDPVTGEIVPTGKRGRKPKADPLPDTDSAAACDASASADYKSLYEALLSQVHERDAEIRELKKELSHYQKEEDSFLSKLSQLIQTEKEKIYESQKLSEGSEKSPGDFGKGPQ